jgi:hypothetical protein
MGIHLPAALAESALNELEIVVRFLENGSALTTQPRGDERLRQVTIEALLCRTVDIFHDVLVSFCVQALGAVEADRRAALSGLDSRWKKLNYEDLSTVKDALSERLSVMRNSGRKIGFSISEELESVISIRHCLVHRAGVADSRALDPMPDSVRSVFGVVLGERICVSPRAFFLATAVFKDFISSGAELLNSDFGMEWEIVDVLISTPTAARRPLLSGGGLLSFLHPLVRALKFRARFFATSKRWLSRD